MPGTPRGANSAISEAAGGFSSVDAGGPLYTKEGVLKHFEEVLGSLELKQQIAELGCGMNSFFTKSRSLTEFTAMSIGLWKLALERSFPNEAEDFFTEFLTSSASLGKGKKRAQMLELVREYDVLFAPQKTDDFTAVAQHMADNLANATADRKALQLRLSLNIRKLYQTIFNHLI